MVEAPLTLLKLVGGALLVEEFAPFYFGKLSFGARAYYSSMRNSKGFFKLNI